MYTEDFRRLMRAIGCLDFRVVAESRITISNPEIQAKVGNIDFYSRTIRAFKLACLEDICEDFGQVAYYLGTAPENPFQFKLDDHHTFFTGKPMLVCPWPVPRNTPAASNPESWFPDAFWRGLSEKVTRSARRPTKIMIPGN